MLNVDQFRKYVALFTNVSYGARAALLHDVQFGCRLGIDPMADLSRLSITPAHWLKSPGHAAFILKKIVSELKRAILVESPSRPLYFINFFAVPKKGPDGRMSALRLIRHGSFSSPNCVSLNDCIMPEYYQISTLPGLREYARLLYQRKWIALRDLSDAFRQLRLHPDDSKYCGYSLFGIWYVDMAVAYGLSSSAASCQRFVELICAIFTRVVTRRDPSSPHDISHCIRNILAYIDDFLLVADSIADIREIEIRFDKLLRRLGVRQSWTKRTNAKTYAVAFGWHWDLSTQTVSIPQPKYVDLLKMILGAVYCRCITFGTLKKINGKLMHYSQLSKRAKMCLWTSTQAVHKYCKTNNSSNSTVLLLPLPLIRHWILWYLLAPSIRSAPIASILYTPSISLYGSCDASTYGAGFILGKHWGWYTFPTKFADSWHINYKEAHAIITLLRTLGSTYTGKRICLYIDNKSVIGAYSKAWTSSASFMPFIWEIILLMHHYHIDIYLEWIPTYANIPADALSRFNFSAFHQYANDHSWLITDQPVCNRASMQLTFPMFNDDYEADISEFARFQAWLRLPISNREPRWWGGPLQHLFPTITHAPPS